MVNSGKLVTVLKRVASFVDLKAHRGARDIDGELVCHVVVQKSIPEAWIENALEREDLDENECHSAREL